MPTPNDTPSALLAALVGSDPTRPRLTWYDDRPGPTAGERIELSGRVLGNWTAKAANLLQEDLDAGPGARVAIDLPAHWRAAYWLFAVWTVGAEAVVGGDPAADVVVTTDPAAAGRSGADVVAVTLAGLARAWAGAPLAAGVIDEAKELATYGDRFEPWAAPGAGGDGPEHTRRAAGRTASWCLPRGRRRLEVGLAPGARVMTSSGTGSGGSRVAGSVVG